MATVPPRKKTKEEEEEDLLNKEAAGLPKLEELTKISPVENFKIPERLQEPVLNLEEQREKDYQAKKKQDESYADYRRSMDVMEGKVDSPMMASRRASQKERAMDLRQKRLDSGMINDISVDRIPKRDEIEKPDRIEEGGYAAREAANKEEIRKLMPGARRRSTRGNVNRSKIDALINENMQLQQLASRERVEANTLAGNLSIAEQQRKLRYDEMDQSKMTEAQKQDNVRLIAKDKQDREDARLERKLTGDKELASLTTATQKEIAGIGSAAKTEAAKIAADASLKKGGLNKAERIEEKEDKKSEEMFQKAGGQAIERFTSLDAVEKPKEVKDKLELPASKALVGLVGESNYAGDVKDDGDNKTVSLIDLGIPEEMKKLRKNISEDMSDRERFVSGYVNRILPTLYKKESLDSLEKSKSFNPKVESTLKNLAETAYQIEYQKKYKPGSKVKKRNYGGIIPASSSGWQELF